MIFFKINFYENSFRNAIRVSIRLDPDQVRHSVKPDLGPNYLESLSADNKICALAGKELKHNVG